MPQLVKGGKHAFAWSVVGENGRIPIPPEAFREYGFHEGIQLAVLPGSRTSGGLILGSFSSLLGSPMGAILERCGGFVEGRIPCGIAVRSGKKVLCRVTVSGGGVDIPAETLKDYGVGIGDRLLAVRGSGLALSMILKGPIILEAVKHPELEIIHE
ncbi:MAG: hypothetical protein JXA64_01420 [Candidatus Fermentibacteraceae bacterium]|nr:hypothetical protein [Candidatus Fermentibacteraceae bacterium]MBN2607746.1 hypothetical protein [Candidatus Fermentibacteraceae bacterium]